MAADIDNIISSVENSNPNADILFDLDTGEGESGEEDLVSKATEEKSEEVEAESEDETSDKPSEEEKAEETEGEEEVKESEEETKEETKEEEKPEDKKPARKKPIYIKNGEEEIKLPPQALIRVKEDGEWKEVPLAELTESYSSSQANAKKYFELKKREEDLGGFAKKVQEDAKSYIAGTQKQIQEFTQCLNSIAETAQKGAPLAAIGELFERIGLDSYPIIKNIRNALVENAAVYLELSKEQREYVDLKDELEYRKLREAKVGKVREQAEAEKRKQGVLEEAVSKFKLPDLKTATEIYHKFEQLKQEGKFDGQISADTIGGFWKYYNSGTFTIKVVEKIAPNLLKSEEAMQRLLDVVRTFNPTEEQLAEVIKKSFLSSESQDKGKSEVAEKKKLSFQAKPPAKSSGTTKQGNRKEDLFL